MAARNSAAGRAEGPLLDTLPDDALISIFSCLEFQDRFTRLPLVCKRWRRLVNSPQLLSRAEVFVTTAPFLPRVHSLCSWLTQQAAGRIHELKLDLHQPENGGGPEGEGPDVGVGSSGDEEEEGPKEEEERAKYVADAQQALATLIMSLPQLGARTLRKLDVDFELGAEVRVGLWVTCLQALTRLDLYNNAGNSAVDAPLDRLPRLQALVLAHARLLPAARLPPTLTMLSLRAEASDLLPHQIAGLSRLEHLILTAGRHTAESFDPLRGLTSLRRLLLWRCSNLPACLPQLTWLEALQLANTPTSPDIPDLEQQLAVTLRALRQLTYLWFGCQPTQGEAARQLSRLPEALTGLTRLQCLGWDTGTPAAPALPSGAWLAGLRRVAVPASVAAASLDLLPMMGRLEQLALGQMLENCSSMHPVNLFPYGATANWGDLPSESDLDPAEQRQLSVLRWAARHPPLRRLALHMAGPIAAHVLLNTCLQVQRCNQVLRLESGDALFRMLQDELAES